VVKRKRGFTLIEMLIALALLVIICSVTLGIYNNSMKSFDSLSESVDKRGNCRIALDFIVSNLKEATTISTANSCVNLDGHKIYLKNNILRYDYDSEQVASSISEFSVVALSSFLYKITVKAVDYNAQTIVSLRR
jgi:prepilin-type N-terminal cleavage/methylation domain-containing protein